MTTKVSWLFRKVIEGVGPTGWLLSAMVLLIVFFGLFAIVPAQQQLAELKQHPKPKNEKQTSVMAITHQVPVLDDMPSSALLTQKLQTFFSIAEQYGLEINEVAYTEQLKKGEPVLRYHISFAVEQDYPTIKAFVLAALAALPYLGIEMMSFERESIKQNSVVTNLRFILYMVPS